MPALMAWADLAIAGAGVTSYELCYMGLPSMLLIVAENQRRTAERLSELGMAVNAGTSREFRAGWFGRRTASFDGIFRAARRDERVRTRIGGWLGQRAGCAPRLSTGD